MDFIAIGDTTVDEFIHLKEATISCDEGEACTISMPWGDKIPFEAATRVPGVGNSPNAAVSAVRLGLKTGLICDVGKDRNGDEVLEAFKKEGLDPKHVRVHDGIPTNHHYVLWYKSERTILIRHEAYPYAMPEDFEAPKWIYLSSIGDHSEDFHHDLAKWVKEHPETKLAFQPGTFQMEMGKDKLADLYREAELVACNKEEAERILEVDETEIRDLLDQMHALGPKIVLITDGPNGAYASDGSRKLKIPMYPDPKTPLDRTGAGDATTSTFVAALALGKDLEEALRWGPVNSMSVVQEIGAQKGLLSREQLEKFLEEAPEDYKVSEF